MKKIFLGSQIKGGIVLSYLAIGISYLSALVYTPIMLRLLGQSEYGIFSLVSSVVSYLGLLSFGFGSAYIRYYSRYKVKNDQINIAKLNGMFIIIFTIFGILAVIAGLVFFFNISIVFPSGLTFEELNTAKTLILILVLNIAISFPSTIFNTYITANEHFIFQKILQIIRTISNPFLVLPILLLGYGSIGLALLTTTLNIFCEIANAIYCLKKLTFHC
jgi:O-antigen/teichoic acid export membrane protein